MAAVYFVLFDTGAGADGAAQVGLLCDFKPAIGQRLTPAQTLALDIMPHLRNVPRADEAQPATAAMRAHAQATVAELPEPERSSATVAHNPV